MTKQFPRIFSTDSAKAAKASGYGYLNAIHYMAPAATAGVGNLCPNASPECIALCLGTYSGQAAMVADLENGTNSVRESRKHKARLFMRDRAAYMNEIARQIVKVIRDATRDGLEPCIRLNGSTDIAFERIRFDLDRKTIAALAPLADKMRDTGKTCGVTLLELFHWIQFVDYTKNANRLGKAPRNLDLTLSYSARNSAECVAALESGHNVAMVFHGGLPNSFAGFPVIDGDKHDLRHLDAKGGFIVGLSPKGNKAKRDASGFVVAWRETSGALLETNWGALRGMRMAPRLAA
jgi:hypothetical protein